MITPQALSADQQAAHDAVVAWTKKPSPQILTLGGLAGTGKTTTIAQIVKTLRAQQHRDIVFCAFTGKASLVMRKKLDAAAVLNDDYCGTIHGLIYQPRKKDGKLIWDRVPSIGADLIVLDEASMVDEILLKDLCSYNIPILAVGDHGQLPPVSGALNLMANPAIRLEKIHRQAEGNPIVQMSMRAREGKGILCGAYGAVTKVARRQIAETVDKYPDWFDRAGMVLCGTNNTRNALNHLLRARRGFQGAQPQVGERVICLRNQREAELFNGLTGVLRAIEPIIRDDDEAPRYAKATVEIDGNGTWEGVLRLDQFGNPKTIPSFEKGVALFDWGYAMTVHKAQGSEAPVAIVFDECSWMESEDLRRRWKYTAYTRAAEQLLIVG